MEIIEHGAAQQGTFNGNPLVAAAGVAALTEVLTPDAYEHLARLGTRLAEGCAKAMTEHGIPGHTVDFGAKGCVSYRPEPLRNYRDFLETSTELYAASYPWIVNRGVFMTPGDEEQWTISVQHTDDDVDALRRGLRRLLRRAGRVTPLPDGPHRRAPPEQPEPQEHRRDDGERTLELAPDDPDAQRQPHDDRQHPSRHRPPPLERRLVEPGHRRPHREPGQEGPERLQHPRDVVALIVRPPPDQHEHDHDGNIRENRNPGLHTSSRTIHPFILPSAPPANGIGTRPAPD